MKEVKTHTTKDGRIILISDLNDNHLKNIIKKFEKQANEGLSVYNDSFPNGIDILFGSDALDVLNYQDYVDELNSRSTSENP